MAHLEKEITAKITKKSSAMKKQSIRTRLEAYKIIYLNIGVA
tara:strand:- start:354 stop:479 length:126 start_codon:yes stop_codon:yes gene_type:complete